MWNCSIALKEGKQNSRRVYAAKYTLKMVKRQMSQEKQAELFYRNLSWLQQGLLKNGQGRLGRAKFREQTSLWSFEGVQTQTEHGHGI